MTINQVQTHRSFTSGLQTFNKGDLVRVTKDSAEGAHPVYGVIEACGRIVKIGKKQMTICVAKLDTPMGTSLFSYAEQFYMKIPYSLVRFVNHWDDTAVLASTACTEGATVKDVDTEDAPEFGNDYTIKEVLDNYKALVARGESEEPCASCDRSDDDCAKCYPELGYPNTKLERDTEAFKKTAPEIIKMLSGNPSSERPSLSPDDIASVFAESTETTETKSSESDIKDVALYGTKLLHDIDTVLRYLDGVYSRILLLEACSSLSDTDLDMIKGIEKTLSSYINSLHQTYLKLADTLSRESFEKVDITIEDLLQISEPEGC